MAPQNSLISKAAEVIEKFGEGFFSSGSAGIFARHVLLVSDFFADWKSALHLNFSTTSASWNPLQCSGTALPPNLLLVSKLIFLNLLLRGYFTGIQEPFLPLLGIMDQIENPRILMHFFRITMFVAGIFLLVNRMVRFCSFSAGFIYLCALLANPAVISAGKFFSLSMLILIGLYSGPKSISLIRWQIVIMYFGAALNKLFLADWRNGQYFEHWMNHIIHSKLYIGISSFLPPRLFSVIISWLTIITEFALAAGFLIPRLYAPAIVLALLFHAGSVVLAGTLFGIYITALIVSFLVFVDWPESQSALFRYKAHNAKWTTFQRITEALDFDQTFVWERIQENVSAQLSIGHRSLKGMNAAIAAILLLPFTYFLITLSLIAVGILL